MLRKAKLGFLKVAHTLGANSMLMASRWRQQRLAILCYHGVSLKDEHLWRPALFMSRDVFRSRMQHLQRSGCNVLPLGEGLARLWEGTLPPKAVVLTFDDGGFDFYARAFPVLQEFRFPATVYLTTSYCVFNRPVFNVMVSYLLWRSRGRILSWPELIPESVGLNDERIGQVEAGIRQRAREQKLSDEEKDALLRSLAERVSIDYDQICADRMLHLMTPQEAKQIASAGIDVQLHTHRHQTPRVRTLFLKEIEENRNVIRKLNCNPAVDFCYPCGVYMPEHLAFLREAGIRSATTCEGGLASRGDDPLLLPRVTDVNGLTSLEFESWISGLADFLPQRRSANLEEAVLEEISPTG